MEYTNIKISKRDKEMLERLRNELKVHGLQYLDSLEVPCPRCKKLMSGVRITAEHWECPHCGYSEDGLAFGAKGSFALGALVGAVSVALLAWLFQQWKK
jgi:ribosomal protein L37AE/L43A